MTFRVGQKVVCIRHRDGAGCPGANYPKVGIAGRLTALVLRV
jgi:hypothetical protein